MNWLKRLFGGSSLTPEAASTEPAPPSVEEMNHVIPAFGQLMERNAGFAGAVFDEAALPVPKARLEFVLFCAIGLADDERQAQQVVTGLLHLADYQPDLGSVPITQVAELPDTASLTTPEAIRSAARAISAHALNTRYSQFEARVKHDLERLRGLADKAIAARAARAKRESGR